MDIIAYIKSNIMLIATVLILFLFIAMAAVMFQPSLQNPTVIFKEAPLQKNTQLQLQPGEEYQYSYMFNGTAVNITYAVLEGDNCTRVVVEESVNDSETCLDNWGNDFTHSNATFDNPSILLFKPWMLALDDGWTWNNSMYIVYGGAEQHISDTYYKVVRMENYSGRMSYVVEVIPDSGSAEYDWIDAQKRVLLKIEGDGYEVLLGEGMPQG